MRPGVLLLCKDPGLPGSGATDAQPGHEHWSPQMRLYIFEGQAQNPSAETAERTGTISPSPAEHVAVSCC